MIDDVKTTFAGMERHVIAVLTMVLVALILWVGNGVQQAQVKLAAIEVELNYIKQGVNRDAGKMNEVERRLDRIEQQLSRHVRELTTPPNNQ